MPQSAGQLLEGIPATDLRWYKCPECRRPMFRAKLMPGSTVETSCKNCEKVDRLNRQHAAKLAGKSDAEIHSLRSEPQTRVIQAV